jgi:hypothetical protein
MVTTISRHWWGVAGKDGSGKLRISGRKSEMPAFPLEFRAIPGPGPPQSIQRAHELISGTYNKSLQLLKQDDCDPLRLRFHISQLRDRIFPLFTALSNEDIPQEWLNFGAHLLGRLLVELESAAAGAKEQ